MAALKDLIRNPNAAELDLAGRFEDLPQDERRDATFEAFAKSGLPHRRMEAWKWTDFKAALPELSSSEVLDDPFESIELPTLRFDGETMSGQDSLPKGVRFFLKEGGQALGGAEQLPMGAVTAALAKDTWFFEVTEAIKTPIRLVFSGAGGAAFNRVVFVVRPAASISLIESYVGGASLNAALLDFGLQTGATLKRTIIQPAAADQTLSVTAEIHLDAEADYAQTILAFGAKLARIETRLHHKDTGAKATLNAAYLAADGYHIDLTSHVSHEAIACETVQRTKGAVLNGGTGVFQGKFYVPRHVGQQTDADMQHNALLLEEGAVVNAKPELEIYADDVECAHGNTCGALDAEALFYMRQRGIPEATARALLTEAFIAEALEIADEAVHDLALASARSWLTNL
ncbi:MAG: SufD family Fe-S cluster assembly protein [Pseudomonadota bacterium]